MKNVITRKFSVVPSIVVIHEDEISLYVGDNAFEWFNIISTPSTSPTIELANNGDGIERNSSTIVTRLSSEKKGTQQTSPKSIMEIAKELSMDREKF
jgi:hypothetical protein